MKKGCNLIHTSFPTAAMTEWSVPYLARMEHEHDLEGLALRVSAVVRPVAAAQIAVRLAAPSAKVRLETKSRNSLVSRMWTSGAGSAALRPGCTGCCLMPHFLDRSQETVHSRPRPGSAGSSTPECTPRISLHGLPFFAIEAPALEREGDLVLGVVHGVSRASICRSGRDNGLNGVRVKVAIMENWEIVRSQRVFSPYYDYQRMDGIDAYSLCIRPEEAAQEKRSGSGFMFPWTALDAYYEYGMWLADRPGSEAGGIVSDFKGDRRRRSGQGDPWWLIRTSIPLHNPRSLPF